MSKDKKNLEEKEEKKTDLKDKMLSDDDLGQVSGGVGDNLTLVSNDDSDLRSTLTRKY